MVGNARPGNGGNHEKSFEHRQRRCGTTVEGGRQVRTIGDGGGRLYAILTSRSSGSS